MRTVNPIAVVVLLLFFATVVPAETRVSPRVPAAEVILPAPSYIVGVPHALLATKLVTLPPEEKPKTHWPWWLRILAVIGVIVFIRLVAGSVRNNPGKPGPG